MPATQAAAPAARQANALALQAVRALLAEARDRAGLPSSDRDWRFLLALYEAELDGRALTPAEAAEAAAIPPQSVEATADRFETEDFLAPRAQGGALRLTEEACEHLAIWVYALNPLQDQDRLRLNQPET